VTSPRVSVIVPAYNYAAYLPDALDSVIEQSFDDWECIVVDDGSTDDTAAVAQSYASRDRRIRLIRQDNRGVSAARNMGLRHATGAFIQFLDADDCLRPTKLERHVRFLTDYPQTDIVYGEVTYFTTAVPQREMRSRGGRLSRSLMAHVHGAGEALKKLEYYNFLAIHCALVRRTVFDRAGVFEETSRGCEDWDLWLRAAALGCRFDFDGDAPVAAVRSHPAGATVDAQRILSGLIAVAARFPETQAYRTLHRLPRAYEMALGVEMAQSGQRWRGSRRIWRATRGATEMLTALRWRFYAVGALVLSRSLFRALVRFPIPESALEYYRLLRSRRRTSS
jgi:GT2 family glycosyltransferase